jgi:hypothetical protein
MAAVPLNLLIVQMVEKYGQMPRSFLYRQVPASQREIERQLLILAEDGALTLKGDEVIAGGRG